MKEIIIARDFSVFPGGRSTTGGPFSGEEFREQHLIPALEAGEETLICFDGVRGYGTSFLEEAFGGLVRRGYPQSRILKSFKFQSERQSYTRLVLKYIEDAEISSNKLQK